MAGRNQAGAEKASRNRTAEPTTRLQPRTLCTPLSSGYHLARLGNPPDSEPLLTLMRISHRHRFVFFASPKTGSRSVRKLLDAHAEIHGRPADEVTADFPFYNHMRPVEVRDVFRERGWDFDTYFKFVMVRSPWSRLVSLYEMFAFREGGQLSRLRRRATRHRGFRAWVRTLDPEGRNPVAPGLETSVIRFGAFSFSRFTGDDRGRALVDEVIKLEEIESGLPPILERLGLPLPPRLPRMGRGRYRGSYRAYYDDETRELVETLYAEDIERFGYTF